MSANGNANGNVSVATTQLAAAERTARAIVFAFELSEGSGAPLSHAQKTYMIEAALIEFDGFEAELTTFGSLDKLFRALGRDARSG